MTLSSAQSLVPPVGEDGEMASNWVSYDSIAQTYHRLISRRLTGPANAMAARSIGSVPPRHVLDLGTGTGVATRAIQRILNSNCSVVGVDVSREMLLEARRSGLTRLAMADATQLPFPNETFDVVIASFVMSHLPDSDSMMQEVVRVLRSDGRFAATAWAESRSQSNLQSDWRTVALRYVSEELLENAQSTVVPSEDRFARSDNLRSEFTRNGFTDIDVVEFTESYEVSLNDHISERAAYSGGRFMRATLPPERWQEFLSEVGAFLRSRYPDSLSIDNSFLLAIGRKP